jgi:glycosyltransferase involved in cell wall biosynthesis
MNLLLASVDSFPNMGGISTMAHHLANAFTDLAHEVVYVGPRGTYVPRDLSRRYSLFEDWDSQVQHRSGEEGLVEDARIRALFGKIIERYSIQRVLLVHPFYYGIGAFDACCDAQIPLSVYFHGFELRSQLKNKYPAGQRRLLRDRLISSLRERTFYLVGMADEILVNSRYTGSLFEPFQVKPEVFPTGCGIPESDLERELAVTEAYDAEQKRARRATLGLPLPTCLGYIGRLVPTKGIERMLTLCSQQPSLSAVIVGDGPDEARLKTLARSWGLDDRVAFLGRVDEADKWQLLRAMDFLCLLSEPDDGRGQVEGFGIALLEGAAAAAVPVSSGTGGMVDVVENLHTGLVLPSNDTAAGTLLTRMAKDSASMALLVETARQQLASRFTWTAVAGRILKRWNH